MNAPGYLQTANSNDQVHEGCLAALQRFRAEDIQHLEANDLLLAQELVGHGNLWGHWQTSKALAPSTMAAALRNIDFARRLQAYLAKEIPSASPVDLLVDEGVLTLTRLALLMRLVPSGRHGHRKGMRPKPSSIATHLYTIWPCITARAIRRKAGDPRAVGLYRCLTEADMHELSSDNATRIELERLDTFVARGVWSDTRPLPDIRQTTNPSRQLATNPLQNKSEPFIPFPEHWLAEIGPRVLWVIQELGPHLLRLLEQLPQALQDINWTVTKVAIGKRIQAHIRAHLEHNPWTDRAGKPLSPPFPLSTANGKQGADPREWPPRNWEHIVTLCITLQAAHLFVTLLASAGRIGEVTTLSRGCISIGHDSKDYLNGYTYKLTGNLFGDVRQWPAPEILRQCLGQQERLATAMDWLPRRLEDGLPSSPRFGNSLWLSISVGGSAGENAQVNVNQALYYFAQRLNMDTKPGGANVHAHRFRKTIGRLAGVALFNSPLVLKRLFGHKSIEMTLHYILCDPGVREEAEKVLRELRIMHCAEALEEIHEAMNNGTALPAHGGPGTARLITAVRNEDAKLNESGRVWTEGSAYDLALLLTMQGQGWRLIKSNIVCSKAPGEDGLCQKKRSKGEPNTANCQPQCDNRIVFARRRRDVEQSIEQYLDIARQARDDGQLLVLAATLDNAQDEWANFPDLTARYQADPEVQSLLALCEESEPVTEAA